MSEAEKIVYCKALIDDVSVTDEQISAYLAFALQRIISYVYPFYSSPPEDVSQYDYPQCEIAVRMIARRGGEGEISHSENGVSRMYANVDDMDILQRLVPYVGVL